MPRLLTLSVTLAIFASSATASAQVSGFDVNRFAPSERGSDWFSGESLDLRGSGRLAFGIVGDYAHKPLVLYNGDGSERSALVADQLITHLGASIVLVDRLRFAVDLPIALSQDGSPGTLGGVTYASTNAASVGDLRVGGDLRLFGTYGDPLTMAAGAQVYFPTGDRRAFTGDGNVRVVPRLLAAGDVGSFAYAARLGFDYRAQGDAFAGAVIGSELTFGASAGLRLGNKRFLLGPEIFGATVVENGNAFSPRATPIELLLGGHYHFDGGLRIGAGFGPGLSRAIGEPVMRVVAVVEWFADVKKEEAPLPVIPPPPSDRDHDGVIDSEDACTDIAGPRTSDPQTNGCPPTPPAPPPPLPVKALVDPDRDGDGIVNREDACPDIPGPRDADPRKNGCPAARIEDGQIRIIEEVQFATASAKILPASDGIMNAVLKILVDHPEVAKLSIEGHTDNRGSALSNMTLSKKRAAAVMKWLVDHGVKEERLGSTGFGPQKPIELNDTAEGRQINRRVEFRIRP